MVGAIAVLSNPIAYLGLSCGDSFCLLAHAFLAGSAS